MNTINALDRPLKTAIFGYLGLTFAAASIAMANHFALLDTDGTRRALGLFVGLLVLLTGNFVPKLRPMKSPDRDPVRTQRVERVAGWSLVLTGLATTALYLFAPLAAARTFSALIGVSAMALLTVNWACLSLREPLTLAKACAPSVALDDEIDADARRAARRHRLAKALLLAVLYVFATTCAVILLPDSTAARYWWFGYGLLFLTYEADRRRSCRLR